MPKSWDKQLARAERALAANKSRIESAASTGVASDKTLHGRGYSVAPDGGGGHAPAQKAKADKVVKRRRRRHRRRKP